MGTLYNTIRCKKYRICEECNKIRQVNIVNVTELASRFSANARYSVVMPFNDEQEPQLQLINKLKIRITRKLRKSVDGTFISVETSANEALHLNLITLSNTDLNHLVFDRELKRLGITAYSIKIDSIPSKELYCGNMAIHALKTAVSSENLTPHDNNRLTIEGV